MKLLPKHLTSPISLIPLLFSHLVLLFFTRFTLWPEMVVYPYLLNHGFLLYRDIINPYPPLLAFKLSIFTSLFGYQPAPYQIATWLLILITDIAIFLAALKITKSRQMALAATLFFVILSLPLGVNGLWYDLVQTPFIIVAVYFFARHLQKKIDNVDLLISSVSLAVAFFIKQQALWLVLWFLAVLVYRKWKDKKNLVRPVFIIIAPIMIGLGLETLFILPKGLFGDFFFWTITFPFFKASQMPGYILLPSLRQILAVAALFLIFLPATFKRNSTQALYFLTAVVLILFAYPRFDYFHLIPSLSILSFVFGYQIKKTRKVKSASILIPLAALVFLSIFTLRYLQRNWTNEIRFFEKDVHQTADSIKRLNPDGRPIFLQNVSGQILSVSGTLPTKPWADSFPWYLEIPGVQEKVIAGIIQEKPDLVLYKPYSPGDKYQIASYRPQKIADFLDQNYKEILRIDNNLRLKARLFQ